MGKSIEPKLKKIGEYLKVDSEMMFVVPEYQRAYSWGIQECDKLWEDILNYDEDSKDAYFLGTIIINCQDDDRKMSLIDGQQRTITFLLLLKALLLRLIDKVKELKTTRGDNEDEQLLHNLRNKCIRIYRILYKITEDDAFMFLNSALNNEVTDYYKFDIFAARSNYETTILETKSINEIDDCKSELKLILGSKDFESAEPRVLRKRYKRGDNKYSNYFRNFKFFYNKIGALSESKLKKFAKGFLEDVEIIEIKSWNVDQAINMFNSLNSDGLPLQDADIIAAKLYSNAMTVQQDFNTKWSDFKEITSNLEGKKIATINDILMQYMYIQRAKDEEVEVKVPSVRRYYLETKKALIKDPLNLTADFLKIAKIWEAICDYPILNVMRRFNGNIKLFLISYLFKMKVDALNQRDVNCFLISLLKLFTVLELVDLGYSSSKFKGYLFKLNPAIVDSNISLHEINTAIETHIKNEWKKDDIKGILLDCRKNSIVYLDEMLNQMNSHNGDFIMPDTYEVEHILSKSGDNLSAIREDAQMTTDEFDNYVDLIGNKLILESKINNNISNSWFRSKIKRDDIDGLSYSKSCLKGAQDLVEAYDSGNVEWTKKEIIDRTETMAQRVVDFIFEK